MQAAAAPGPWTLYRVPQALADTYGAKCLDGTPPAFYMSPGAPASALKWRLHLRGGGWCFSAADCANRANGFYGSSAAQYMNPDVYKECPDNNGKNCEAIYGVLNNASDSPIGDWNAVMVEYCDGASFSSNREDPITVNGRQIWFRGRRNLDAMLAYMDALGGLLTNATEVVLTGDSAGGLATYMHANAIAQAVKAKSPSTRVVAVPGAGYFLDTDRLRGTFQNAIQPSLWNATSDSACLAANTGANSWRCWFAQYVYPFINIPVFAVNSAYDPTQLPVNCDLDHNGCTPTQLAQIEAFAAEIRNNISASAAAGGDGKRDGFFVTACHQHEHTCQWRDWDGIVIGGSKMRDVFWNWYQNGGSAATRVADGKFGSDSSCAAPGFAHGSC